MPIRGLAGFPVGQTIETYVLEERGPGLGFMKVTIYATKHCGFCVGAKALLDRLGIAHENIDVTGDRAARAALVQKAGGRRTVPVIVIDDEVIGGFVELVGMAASGELQRRRQEEAENPELEGKPSPLRSKAR